MPTKKRTVNFNLKKYLGNKTVRNTTTFIYTPTEAFYSFNGSKVPEKDFEALYPLEMPRIESKGKGKDGRTNWMQII